MDRILSIVKRRIDTAADIIIKVEKYYILVKDIILSLNPQQNVQCLEALSTIRKFPEDIQDINESFQEGKWLDYGFSLFKLLAAVSVSINILGNMVSNDQYYRSSSMNMSATYTANVLLDRKQILSMIDKYHDIGRDDDNEIISIIVDEVDVKSNIKQILLFVDSTIKKSGETKANKLITELLRVGLLYAKNSERQWLLSLVENEKDIVLGTKRVNLDYYGPQTPLVRYGLVPCTNSMPIWDLLPIIGAKWVSKSSMNDNMSRVARELKVGIIVIDKSCGYPVEFDVRGLVSLDYVTKNNLLLPIQSGLSKKIIERYNTVIELKQGKSVMKHGVTRFDPRVGSGQKDHGSSQKDNGAEISIDKVYVIETINGDLYRLMSNVEGAQNYQGNGQDHGLAVSVDSVKGLLMGMSTRALKYSQIHESTILDKCFDPKSHNILREYEDLKIAAPSSENIKKQVFKDFEGEFAEKIKNSLPTNLYEFVSMSLGDINTISRLLTIRLSQNIQTQGSSSIEYTLTYLSKLDSIIKQFIREFEAQIKKQQISPVIFAERSHDDLIKYLSDTYKDALNATIEELDRASVWTDYEISLKEYFINRKYVVI